MYVNCLKPATVAVIDLEKHEVVAKYPLTLADANYPLTAGYELLAKRLYGATIFQKWISTK